MYREPFQADVALRFGAALQRMGEVALDRVKAHARATNMFAVEPNMPLHNYDRMQDTLAQLTQIEDSIALVGTVIEHVTEDLNQTDLSESFHPYTPAECDIAGRWLQTYTQLNKGQADWLNATIDLDWSTEQWAERAELRKWVRQMGDWLFELGEALPIEYVHNDYSEEHIN